MTSGITEEGVAGVTGGVTGEGLVGGVTEEGVAGGKCHFGILEFDL